MLGLASKIQEIVMMTPGMIIRPKVIMPIVRANGVLVRSTVHARKVPRDKRRRSVDTKAKYKSVETRLPEFLDPVGARIVGETEAEVQKLRLTRADDFQTGPNDQEQRQ